jgi:hypothetical protein
MILLYSVFAGCAIFAGFITAVGIIRGGHAETSAISAIQYTPEDPN